MRKLAIVPVLLIAVFAVISCVTPQVELTEREGGPKTVTIDHKNKAFGTPVPEWVAASVYDLEAKYPDQYVFKLEAEGKDKDGTMTYLAGMQAPTEVARQVATRVKNKFVGAEVGDKDKLETYMENVTKTLSEVTITGLRQVDNYWLLQQRGREPAYYRVVALYIVPKTEVDAAIARSLEAEANRTAAASSEEQTARDRVKEIFAKGMD